MAFTNPILSGEELNRTGIKSENYVPGGAGWRIASNGAAEFDNVGIRGNLWVPSIMLNGRDLASLIDTKARGLVAFMRGYPVVSTTTEAQVIFTEFETIPGRQYEMMLSNITNDQAGTKNCEFVLRYTQGTGTFAYPDNSSGIVATSGRLSQFELGSIRAYHESTGVYVLRLRVSITSYSGTVRSLAPGGGTHLGVYDVGPSRAMVGTVGTTVASKTLKEWTITANDTRSYHQNGSDLGGTFGRDMSQGAFQALEHVRSWASFNASDRALIADLQGVPLEDILVCEWYIKWYYWYQGAGYAVMGHHNSTSLPTTEPGGSVVNSDQIYIAGQVGNWLSMLSGSQIFVNALRAGTAKGLVLGAGTSTDRQYGGIADGAFGTQPPKLHVKYYK